MSSGRSPNVDESNDGGDGRIVDGFDASTQLVLRATALARTRGSDTRMSDTTVRGGYRHMDELRQTYGPDARMLLATMMLPDSAYPDQLSMDDVEADYSGEYDLPAPAAPQTAPAASRSHRDHDERGYSSRRRSASPRRSRSREHERHGRSRDRYRSRSRSHERHGRSRVSRERHDRSRVSPDRRGRSRVSRERHDRSNRSRGRDHRRDRRRGNDDRRPKCANCERRGHKLGDCVKVAPEGFVPGCAHCNVLEHDTDKCFQFKGDQRLFELMVTNRGGLPPLRATTFDWPLEAVNNREQAQYPLLLSEARTWSAAHPQGWVGHNHASRNGVLRLEKRRIRNKADVQEYVDSDDYEPQIYRSAPRDDGRVSPSQRGRKVGEFGNYNLYEPRNSRVVAPQPFNRDLSHLTGNQGGGDGPVEGDGDGPVEDDVDEDGDTRLGGAGQNNAGGELHDEDQDMDHEAAQRYGDSRLARY